MLSASFNGENLIGKIELINDNAGPVILWNKGSGGETEAFDKTVPPDPEIMVGT